MNYSRLFALVGIFLLLQPLPTLEARQLSGEHPNYVVIGAFRIHKNAIRFTSHAKADLSLDARYEMNPNRNLYYVYVLNTSDREEAIAEAKRLREESEFKDTWVYNGFLGTLPEGQSAAMYAGVDINPVSQRSMNPVSGDQTEPNNTLTNAVSDASNDTGSILVSETVSPSEPALTGTNAEEEDEEIAGKKFYFKLSRILDNNVVEGDVDVIDNQKLRKIGTYKGNTNVRVMTPSGNSAQVSLVCEVFGYRKTQRDIDYNNPTGDGIERNEEGALVVPFELVRLQKGDIATMYHVYFFKDAAIMRPESRFEVNSLLEMLRENDKYKIRIHGHANGKASGKIIYAEEGSDNFFSLTRTKEGFGSAKKLSEERAQVIRNFLISNGIDPARMQVKAWGGKKPIHDKHSTRAQENVRVEIEILDN